MILRLSDWDNLLHVLRHSLLVVVESLSRIAEL